MVVLYKVATRYTPISKCFFILYIHFKSIITIYRIMEVSFSLWNNLKLISRLLRYVKFRLVHVLFLWRIIIFLLILLWKIGKVTLLFLNVQVLCFGFSLSIIILQCICVCYFILETATTWLWFCIDVSFTATALLSILLIKYYQVDVLFYFLIVILCFTIKLL